MPRIRNVDKYTTLDTEAPSSVEKLSRRASKHSAKLDKKLVTLVEEQKERIEELSAANLRLTKIVNRFGHYLPRERLEELRKEVDGE